MTTINAIGTQDPIEIAKGGTAASTATASFDNLSPVTTQGDIIFRDASNNARLAKGTANQRLTMNAGATAPEWADDSDSITVTAVPSADTTASGIKITLTANENQAFGDVCRIDTDGEAHIADADAIATSSVVVMCADATISATASGTYLMYGIARQDTWAWTVGGLVYLTITGTTTNTLSQTAPVGNTDVVQVLGVATHADRMMFMPNLAQVELTV